MSIDTSEQQPAALTNTEGECRGHMFPRGRALRHKAGPLLLQYATHGCPVDCGRDWTAEEMAAAIAKGPHLSAANPGAAAQFRAEALAKARQGLCSIVRWADIEADPPKRLKVSPLAAVPHKSRAWRAILDLSFGLTVRGRQLPSVNESTTPLAPPEALDQMGAALPRLIEALATAPEGGGPVVFAKLDIKDGFWRLAVEEGAEWNFAYVLPPAPGQAADDVELVVPSALQMGWCESPAFFCAASETARDVAEDRCREPVGSLPAHSLEAFMLPPQRWPEGQGPERQGDLHRRLEVYVDDFCALAQTTNVRELRHISRALLHSIHEVFPPPAISGRGEDDSISEKKLREGEGAWDTRKELLGWIFDGVARCIELPRAKVDHMDGAIREALRAGGIRWKDYERLLGKIRHASIGVPGSGGLFSPLNMVLRERVSWISFRAHRDVGAALGDFRCLLREATKEPTHVRELVPGLPSFIGHCDACKSGAGGVWHSGTEGLDPVVWRVEWPGDVQDNLVSDRNRGGTISVSDLEMAGLLLHYIVLEYLAVLRHKRIGAFCDNTPTVSWAAKLASKRSRIAGGLLRALALRQRVQRSSPLITLSIAGVDNIMADVSSRSFRGGGGAWARANLSDNDFLLRFNSEFPLPQNKCWRAFRLSSEIASRATSVLRGEKSTLASWSRLPRNGGSIGRIGHDMRVTWASAHTSERMPSRGTPGSELLPVSLAGSGRATTGEAALSVFRQFRSRYAPSGRRVSWSAELTQPTAPQASTSHSSRCKSRASDEGTRSRSQN